jgi:Secretion system C-terminal sorting domain
MKKLYFLLLCTSTAFAQFTYESFNYTGSLNANGWTSHSGATGSAGQIVALTTTSDSGNSLSFTGLQASIGNRTAIVAGNSEDINKAATATITGVAYYSALVKVQNTTALNLNTSTGDYFLCTTSVVGSTTTAFQARLYIKAGTAADTFNLGVLNASGGTAAPSFVSTDLSINTTYFIVVKYDLATNTASLWINPTPGSTESAAGATNATGTTPAPALIAGLIIRQGGNTTASTGNVELDEFRLGTTWAEVTPQNSASVNDNAIAGLKIYPNPNTGNTLYVTSDVIGDKSVIIFDVLGKQILTVSNVTDNGINIGNLKAGIYMVKVTQDGKSATRKLVVQ